MGLGNDCKLYREIDKMVVKTVDKDKRLGVIIDSKLKFDEHLTSLYLKETEILVPFSE